MGFVVCGLFLPWREFWELQWSHETAIDIGAWSSPKLELALEDFTIQGRNLAYNMTPLPLSYSSSKIKAFLVKLKILRFELGHDLMGSFRCFCDCVSLKWFVRMCLALGPLWGTPL